METRKRVMLQNILFTAAVAAIVAPVVLGAGLNLKTATEAEQGSLRLRLVAEARKGGMRFPA
jgi:hypothetical protein